MYDFEKLNNELMNFDFEKEMSKEEFISEVKRYLPVRETMINILNSSLEEFEELYHNTKLDVLDGLATSEELDGLANKIKEIKIIIAKIDESTEFIKSLANIEV